MDMRDSGNMDYGIFGVFLGKIGGPMFVSNLCLSVFGDKDKGTFLEETFPGIPRTIC